MIVFHCAIPALVCGEQIKQKAGGVISVLDGVEHVRKVKKTVHMPFCIHLHAADINTVIARIYSHLQIIKGSLPRIEEQSLTGIIKRPCPGHIFARHGFATGLNTRDALHQAFRNPMLDFGTSGLGKADIVDRECIICRRRHSLWHLTGQYCCQGDDSHFYGDTGLC